MVKRNPNFKSLSENYLFPEVARRVKAFKHQNPHVELISLSIGDTSQPLSATISKMLKKKSEELGTHAGYHGYGPEQGALSLRKKIAHVFYSDTISPEEIFISDGAKCDIGRLQLLFGAQASIAVQDPTYPVYVDSKLIVGCHPIAYLPCTPQNNFFPDPKLLPAVDLLYLCSPNNPTGSTATKEQLKSIVSWAKKNGALIVYDAAYAAFIQDPDLPKSIYEIAGAKEVAIEVSSFSKFAGFTGIRLGWTVIPKGLRFEQYESVHQDYTRLITTFFNGASILSQAGAEAALSENGLEEIQRTINFYMENASLIRHALQIKGYKIYGGMNAPYLWVDFGEKKSWELFQHLMEETHLITTPGSGFGLCGEGFLRFSAFGTRQNIQKAIKHIETKWPRSLELMSPLPI